MNAPRARLGAFLAVDFRPFFRRRHSSPGRIDIRRPRNSRLEGHQAEEFHATWTRRTCRIVVQGGHHDRRLPPVFVERLRSSEVSGSLWTSFGFESRCVVSDCQVQNQTR